MRWLLLSLGLIVAAGVTLWQAKPRAAELPPPFRVGESPDATKRAPIAALGVSSCAAAACHHGNGPRGSLGSEYSTWIAVDPHAKAFSTLHKPESRRMHAILARDNPALLNKGAHRNPLCLRCHGMGEHVSASLQTDGVGCERCHGPAEKWKSTHFQHSFDRSTPGFVDLRDDLTVRVESCMKCHVGDRTMEVDHDLIAAGHPRLRFEYAAYFANYPRHWVEKERSRVDADIEIRNWLLGQVVAARSATELLVHRAGKPDAWPEFAEFDCAACHHNLKPDLPMVRPGVKLPLGQLRWGTWYYPLLPGLAGAVEPRPALSLQTTLSRLDVLMRKRLPPTKQVQQEATALVKQLRSWEGKIAKRRFHSDEANALMRLLATLDQPIESGWDGGTQLYLGLAAVYHGWTDLDSNFKKTSTLREPLQAMRKSLADAYPAGVNARPLYDIPSNYRPVVLKGLLKQLLREVK